MFRLRVVRPPQRPHHVVQTCCQSPMVARAPVRLCRHLCPLFPSPHRSRAFRLTRSSSANHKLELPLENSTSAATLPAHLSTTLDQPLNLDLNISSKSCLHFCPYACLTLFPCPSCCSSMSYAPTPIASLDCRPRLFIAAGATVSRARASTNSS